MIASWLVAGLAVAAPPPVRQWVETADHAWIALHRRPQDGPAVVLCHGLSSNHRFWDLDETHSLAVALWDAGFDVWNLDLRGHGDAERTPDGSRQRPGWTLDDYGDRDLVAAFAAVRAARPDAPLAFVAHSMGGMAFAVYLAHHPEPAVDAAVIVSSPLDFRDPDRVMSTLLEVGGALPAVGIPTPWGARLLAGPFGRALPLQAEALLYEPAAFRRETARAMLRTVVSPVTAGEVRQLASLTVDGELRPVGGGDPYRAALGAQRLPMLFVAGRGDHVVSPDRVRAYHDAVGSPDKTWWMLSRAEGWSHDYGHLDFGCADRAATDLFPRMAAWLHDRI